VSETRPSVAISIEQLTKRFGNQTALDGLTLDIPVGEVFGFLGPNGAGKSTTLRLLLGLLAPTSGSARIMGTDVRDVREVHRHTAYVPGDVSLWPKLSGGECLELFANLRGGVDDAYQAALVEQFRLDTTKRARAYSRGNRQKVALVAAFAARADVLLLDEPTSGLDPLMEQQFRACVAEATARGQTVFLSSHILSEVEQICSRVGILRAGRLVEVAPIQRLRAMHSTEIELDVDGPIPELGSVAGVERVTATPTGVRVTLNGPPGPVLRAVEHLPITGIRAQEESLEHIFLTYYGENADQAHSTDAHG
jgi:ABC-2 type transport system ATP-binding protein